MGKPVGRLAKPELLRAMDITAIEIDRFLKESSYERKDFYKELSSELGIPEEHVSPYKMSLLSLLNVMRHIKVYGENHIRIHEDAMISKACHSHGAVSIGSNACHGCPEFLFHVVDNTTNTVVCDTDMSYGDYIGGNK